MQIWQTAAAARTETLIGHPGNAGALQRAKQLGVNSIALHIDWGAVEPAEGEWDFSRFIEKANEIVAAGLVWVPQLVFAAKPPAWFAEKGLSLKQLCIEHGKANGPESIWNPNLRTHLPRYYQAFLRHIPVNLLEKIYHVELFACQYGEPNYFFIDRSGPVVPGWGGALHYGFQCGDELARRDFSAAMARQYGSIERLNAAWGTRFSAFDEARFIVPEAELSDPKNDFAAAFDEQTLTYRFDEHLEQRLAMGRRWADQVRWYRLAMNDYFEFVVRTAREVFGERRLCARLGGCNLLNWLGAWGPLNVKSAARHGAEIRFTGAVHAYDQKVLSTATRFYRTGLWTEPMYAIGRQTGPTMVRGRRWFEAVFFGAACGQNLTRSEYTNSFFDKGEAMEANFPVYQKAVAATALGQPFVRFAMFLPTLQTSFGLDHRYFMGKFTALLDYADADILDEQLIADGAIGRYDAVLIRSGGLVEPGTLQRLAAYVEAGGLLVIGPRGLLRTLEDAHAGWPLMGLGTSAKLLAGGKAELIEQELLKRIEPGRQIQAEACAADPDGQVLGRCADGACIWLRRAGKGAVLVCLCDEDAVLIGAMIGAAEALGGFAAPDGRDDGVLMTQLGEELLLFNTRDEPRRVEIGGDTVELQPYDENAMPLTRVKVAAPGPAFQSLQVEPAEGGYRVIVKPSDASAGGYLELRRPDYRTQYIDL